MVQAAWQAIVLLLALAVGESVADDSVTATRLDGTAVTGSLTAWGDDHIVVATDAAEERLPTDQLVALRWPSSQRSGSNEGPDGAELELIDGSVFSIREFEVADSSAHVKLAGEALEGRNKLSIPLKSIASVRLQRLDSEAEQQWMEILAQDFPSDVLAVVKRGGKSLDYVEGVVGDISMAKIEFKFDGDLVRVDRSKVAGVAYYRGREAPKAEPRCILHGRSGLRVHAANVRLESEVVAITTAAGITLQWPLEDLSYADFSAGKIVYLSDLEPASEDWTPFVELPAGALQAARYGEFLRDQSAFGGPLAVSVSDSEAAGDLRRINSYGKGLALRSRTQLVYRLPAGYRQFIALAGIDAAANAAGNARLTIYGDERPLFEADIAGNQPAKSIELDVAGVRRLKIVVDFAENLDLGDWINLCDARLVK